VKVYTCHTAAPGPFGRVIRWVTGAEVSHSLLLVYSTELRSWLVAEALGDQGVVLRPAERSAALPHTRRAFRLLAPSSSPVDVGPVVTAVAGAELAREVVRSVGSGYDWANTVGWLAAGIGNRLAGSERWVPRYESPSRLNCSETIARALQALGFLGPWEPLSHPGMLAAAQLASPWFEPVNVRWLLGEVLGAGGAW